MKKKLDIDFEKATSEELGKFLESFYVEIRQKNGDVYSKTSMLGCRAAIQRHLKWQGGELNIFSDKAFERANAVLDRQLKKPIVCPMAKSRSRRKWQKSSFSYTRSIRKTTGFSK